MTSSQPRRDKRLVAETEKDERYWEKRAKNNISARKSREHRRQMDSVVRKRAVFLEEENALLKKEVAILKEKLGIPEHVTVLTNTEREDCLNDLWEEARANKSCNIFSPENSKQSSCTNIDQFEQKMTSPKSSVKTVYSTNSSSNIPDREQSYMPLPTDSSQYCYILTNSTADTSLPLRDDEPFDLSPRSNHSNLGLSNTRHYEEMMDQPPKKRRLQDSTDTVISKDLSVKRGFIVDNTMTSSSDATFESRAIVTSSNMLHDIKKAQKQPVSIDLIGERLSSDVQAKLNNLSQQIAQMQRSLDM